MTTTRTEAAVATRLLSEVRGADMILTAAQAGDLPMPRSTSINTFAVTTFLFATLDDLTQWAIWADEPISDRIIGESVFHELTCELFDQRIRLVVILDRPLADLHSISIEQNPNEPRWRPRSRRAVCSCNWASGWFSGPQGDNQARSAGFEHVNEVSAA